MPETYTGPKSQPPRARTEAEIEADLRAKLRAEFEAEQRAKESAATAAKAAADAAAKAAASAAAKDLEPVWVEVLEDATVRFPGRSDSAFREGLYNSPDSRVGHSRRVHIAHGEYCQVERRFLSGVDENGQPLNRSGYGFPIFRELNALEIQEAKRIEQEIAIRAQGEPPYLRPTYMHPPAA